MTVGSERIRVMLVDDHAVVRSGLAAFLMAFDDLELVGEAGDGAEALSMCGRVKPDVVLMDLVMPQMDGLEATERIKAQYPTTGVVMISIHDDEEKQVQAKAAGADSFLAKGTETETLIQTIQNVADRLRAGH